MMTVEKKWQPKSIAFCCRHCAYGAADTAGIMRLQYPSEVRIIRVPFARAGLTRSPSCVPLRAAPTVWWWPGVWRAAVTTWWETPGAGRRVERMRTFLSEVGLEAERLEMHHLAASMGTSFARMAAEFTGRVRLLGPIFPPVHAAAAEGRCGP